MKHLIITLLLINCSIAFSQDQKTILDVVSYDCVLDKLKYSLRDMRFMEDLFRKIVGTNSLSKFKDSKELFVIDSYDSKDGSTYLTIWNDLEQVHVKYNNGSLTFQSKSVLDQYLLELIQKWDVNELRERESEFKNLVDSKKVTVLKVLFVKEKGLVDCFSFQPYPNSALVLGDNTVLDFVNYDCAVQKLNRSTKEKKFLENLFQKIVQTTALKEFKGAKDLFVVDAFDENSNTTYVTVWNKEHIVNVKYVQNSIVFEAESIFEKKILQLIAAWNVDEMNQLENANISAINSELFNVLKVDLGGGEVVTDCFSFKAKVRDVPVQKKKEILDFINYDCAFQKLNYSVKEKKFLDDIVQKIVKSAALKDFKNYKDVVVLNLFDSKENATYLTIFNKEEVVNVKYYQKAVTFESESVFHKDAMMTIVDWNLEVMNKMKIADLSSIEVDDISALKIDLIDNEIFTDCFSFPAKGNTNTTLVVDNITVLDFVNYDCAVNKLNYSINEKKHIESIFQRIVKTDGLKDFKTAKNLFVLDTYDAKSDATYITIWNKEHQVNVKYHQNSITFLPESIFDVSAMNIISAWNLAEMNKMKHFVASSVTSQATNVLKVDMQNGSVFMDCFSFHNNQSNTQILDKKSVLDFVNYDCAVQKLNYSARDKKFMEILFQEVVKTKALKEFEGAKNLFVLDAYDDNLNATYLTIWNNEHVINVKHFQNTITFESTSIFDQNVLKVISDWNLNEIKKLEDASLSSVNSELFNVLKVDLQGGEIVRDCFSFKSKLRNESAQRKKTILDLINYDCAVQKLQYSIRDKKYIEELFGRLVQTNSFYVFEKSKELFVIEAYDATSETTYLSIWDKDNLVNIKYHQNVVVFQPESILTKGLRDLVSEWKVSLIKQFEKDSGPLENPLRFTILKVSLEESESMIDCFSFNEFSINRSK